MIRKLFFSFTTLMNAIYEGKLTDADLVNSIFFMVRSRDNIFSVKAYTDWVRYSGNKDEPRAHLAHSRLLAVLACAENVGRASFGFKQQYSVLNSMLDGLGLPSLFRTEVCRDDTSGPTSITPEHRIEYYYLRKMLALNCPVVELAEV